MLEWLALIGFVLACAAVTISLKTERWSIRILCIVYIVACIVTQIVCHVNGWQSYFESEPKPSKEEIAYMDGYDDGYEDGYYQCLEDYGIDDGVDVYIEGYLPKPDSQSETQGNGIKIRE